MKRSPIKIIGLRYATLLETLIAVGLMVIVLSTMTFFYRQIDAINIQAESIQKESFRMRYVENRLNAILPKAISKECEEKDFYFYTSENAGGPFLPGSPVSLVFTYDNGIDLSKVFSNRVLGRLYVDEAGRLSLATWPIPQRWAEGGDPPMKKEVLMENVDGLRFQFFVGFDKKWQIKEANQNPSTALTPNGGNEANPAPPNKPAANAKTPENPPKPAPAPSQPEAAAPSSKTSVVKPDGEGTWIEQWSQDYQLLPSLVRLIVTRKGATEAFAFPLSNTPRQIVYSQ